MNELKAEYLRHSKSIYKHEKGCQIPKKDLKCGEIENVEEERSIDSSEDALEEGETNKTNNTNEIHNEINYEINETNIINNEINDINIRNDEIKEREREEERIREKVAEEFKRREEINKKEEEREIEEFLDVVLIINNLIYTKGTYQISSFQDKNILLQNINSEEFEIILRLLTSHYLNQITKNDYFPKFPIPAPLHFFEMILIIDYLNLPQMIPLYASPFISQYNNSFDLYFLFATQFQNSIPIQISSNLLSFANLDNLLLMIAFGNIHLDLNIIETLFDRQFLHWCKEYNKIIEINKDKEFLEFKFDEDLHVLPTYYHGIYNEETQNFHSHDFMLMKVYIYIYIYRNTY